ncbi:ATP-binding protein [Nodosilinea sp. P-1105]|uniref:ATP-binding protein n=1 Tax=Nodosilinea sp. P-1105 TaxID=2546229 RepID=UPI001981C709|nr:ATP-binding protein [Nodosilinea sp. P-1105]
MALGEIQEIHAFGDVKPVSTLSFDFEELDRQFAAAQQQADLDSAHDEQQEDTVLGQWLQTAGECLVLENPTADAIDTQVEVDFPGGKNYPQLHARVRLIYRDEGDREKHLSMRALLRSHHAAYRARLKTAMTTAGIDHALSFRRLLIFRIGDLPGGATTQELTQRFTGAGGLMIYPSDAELRVLAALHQIKDQDNFATWLRDRRPASQLPSFQDTVAWLFGEATHPAPQVTSTPKTSTATPGGQTTTNSPEGDPPSPPPITPFPVVGLPIGQRLGPRPETLAIPLEALTKHTVVLAGSGAGKTVLVRRLVEEAILQNIPAIVIDGANDLARMGDPWPKVPVAWAAEDGAKAQRYQQRVDVRVWTPGREAGNAVNLNPLPDFAALSSDADELDQAIDMARDSLQDMVASGNSASAKVKRGILRNALKEFADNGGGNLETFAEFLRDLPEEAAGNIAKADKHAQEMADLLSAEMANNPLLRQSGAPLEPAILLGLHGAIDQTRLSILNFIGLPGLPQQQQFLNQLAMTLFTWIKKNPAPTGQPLRGLLVIDEAKDFLPSQGSTPCKSSLIRLAAQARKYGLGLIFATQAPKSIDHNIIANCSTQFYGRANSPAAIDVVRDQLRQRGGQGDDIAQLERGQFYVASESINPPVKIAAPLCLSYHPPSPLDELGVLERARRSR